MGANKVAEKRLMIEYRDIQQDPPPHILARPLETNLLEWHYVITGPPNTIYQGGEYYGTVTFPKTFPFDPPKIMMVTPSGRFEPGKRLCLSMSDFHPESWNPAWKVSTILIGLLSFMLEDGLTTGAIKTEDAEKRALAKASWAYNRQLTKFNKVFPDLMEATPSSPPKEADTKKRAPSPQKLVEHAVKPPSPPGETVNHHMWAVYAAVSLLVTLPIAWLYQKYV